MVMLDADGREVDRQESTHCGSSGWQCASFVAASSLCKLKVKDFRHARKGVPHLKVVGMGGKTRYLPLHPGTNGLINDYLAAAGHGLDEAGALFRPVRNNRIGRLEAAITADGVYRLVRRYSGELAAHTRCARPPPPTRSTTRPKAQGWLGHASAAIRMY